MVDAIGKHTRGSDGERLTRAASLEAFASQPVGRYLAGPTWINLCAERDLWIQIVWGPIEEADVQGLLDSLRLLSSEHGPHALLFDCSCLEDMSVKDAYRLRRFLVEGQSHTGPRSTRQALVCSLEAVPILRDARVGASPQHASEAFACFNEALAWLNPRLPADLRASILNVRAALTPDARRLARLRQIISDADVTNLDIAFVARHLGCSRRSLQRELARWGTTFRAELNRIRIERAKRSLSTGVSVTWLAYELGFGSAQSFIRGFKQHTGQTPGNWRRNAPDV